MTPGVHTDVGASGTGGAGTVGAGTGGTTGSGAGGTGGTPMPGWMDPNCPASEPSAGDACDVVGTYCKYYACAPSSLWRCEQDGWFAERACGTFICPDSRPEFLTACWPLEGIECYYNDDCCGTLVKARCDNGVWLLYGDSHACPICQSAIPGEVCDLPIGCENTACYSISCYGEPLVIDCVDGMWREQTKCSK